jgi:hypothetical protein
MLLDLLMVKVACLLARVLVRLKAKPCSPPLPLPLPPREAKVVDLL